MEWYLVKNRDKFTLLFYHFKVTGWRIGVLVFDSRRGLEIFLFTTASRTALGPI
jgi:hypothetical protein